MGGRVWLKAVVSKTTGPYAGSVGSNPTPSASTVSMPYKDIELQRAAQAAWARRNPETISKHRRATRERLVARVRELKDGKPCTDCKVAWPYYVLQFDHVRGPKLGNVAEMVGAALSWASIEAEIAKCELVCANCHAARTHVRICQGIPVDGGGAL